MYLQDPLRNLDGLSEWLKSLTRNQMGSAREGSNPSSVAFQQTSDCHLHFKFWNIFIIVTVAHEIVKGNETMSLCSVKHNNVEI